MILYIENPKESIKNTVRTNKQVQHNCRIWDRKITCILYISNEQSKDKIKKKEVQNLFILKRYMHHYVHAALFTVAKVLNQPKCSSSLQN